MLDTAAMSGFEEGGGLVLLPEAWERATSGGHDGEASVPCAPCEEPLFSTSPSLASGSLSGEGSCRPSAGYSYECPTHRSTFDGCTDCGSAECVLSCGRQHRARRNGVLSLRGRRNGILNLRLRRNGVLESDSHKSEGHHGPGASPRSGLTSPCSLNGGLDCCCRTCGGSACGCLRTASDNGGQLDGARAAAMPLTCVGGGGQEGTGPTTARLGSAPSCRHGDIGGLQPPAGSPRQWRPEFSGPRGGAKGYRWSSGLRSPQAQCGHGLEQCHSTDSVSAAGLGAEQAAASTGPQELPPQHDAPLGSAVSDGDGDGAAVVSGGAREAGEEQRVVDVQPTASRDCAPPPDGSPSRPGGSCPTGSACDMPGDDHVPVADMPAPRAQTAGDAGGGCAQQAGLAAHSAVVAPALAAAGTVSHSAPIGTAGKAAAPCSDAPRRAVAEEAQPMPAATGPHAGSAPQPEAFPTVRPALRRVRSLAAIIAPPPQEPDHPLPSMSPQQLQQQPRLHPHPPPGPPRQRQSLQPSHMSPDSPQASQSGWSGPTSPHTGLRRAVSSLSVAAAALGPGQEVWRPQGSPLLSGLVAPGPHDRSPRLAVTGTAIAVLARPPARAWAGSGTSGASSRRASMWSNAAPVLSDVEDKPEEEGEGAEAGGGTGSPAGGPRVPSRRAFRIVAVEAGGARAGSPDGEAAGTVEMASGGGGGGGGGSADVPKRSSLTYHSFTLGLGTGLCRVGPPAQPGAALWTQGPVSGPPVLSTAGLGPLAPQAPEVNVPPPRLMGTAPGCASPGPERGRASSLLRCSWPAPGAGTEGAVLAALASPPVAGECDGAGGEVAAALAESPLEGRLCGPRQSTAPSSADVLTARPGRWLQPSRQAVLPAVAASPKPWPPAPLSSPQGSSASARPASDAGVPALPAAAGAAGGNGVARQASREVSASAAGAGAAPKAPTQAQSVLPVALPRIAGAMYSSGAAGR